MLDPVVGPDDPGPIATSPAFGLRRALALVRSAGRPAVLLVFGVLGVLSGFLEAAVILLVVGIAAALADGTEVVALDLGPLDLSTTPAQGVVVGLGVTALLLACAIPSAWLKARLAADLLRRTRARLSRALLAASWEQQSKVVEARFQDLAAVHAFKIANLVLIILNFVTNVLGLLALVLAAFVIDVVTAASLASVVVLLAVAFRPLVQTIRQRSRAHLTEHQTYLEHLANLFGVLPELRVFGARDAADQRLERSNQRTAIEYRHMMFRGLVLPAVYVGATSVLLLVGLAIAGTQEGLGLTKVGAVVLFLLRSLRYSQQVQGGMQSIMEHLPYIDQMDDALDEWGPRDAGFGRRPLERVGTIELRGVSYRYPNGELGIADLSLSISRGEIVGLTGPSGAGKSTIAQLVLGLRRPTQGTYLVDGISAQEFEESSWFSRFAYVAQDSRLIAGDVRENVRFLRPEVSDADADAALEQAGIGRDTARWATGPARLVGSGGRELSGGQRQRIAIARALAGRPDVLVMDEPTSALDKESEDIVRSTLMDLKGKVAVLLIAHRESTLTVCDRVLFVDHHHAAPAGSAQAAAERSRSAHPAV